MPTASRKLIARLALVLVVLLVAAFSAFFVVTPQRVKASDGGYPYASYNGPGSDASQDWWTDPNQGSHYGKADSPYHYYYRNCTDFVAWKLAANGFNPGVSMGNGDQWVSWAQNNGYADKVDTNPAPGSVAAFSYNHVAYVDSVATNTDGSVASVTIEEYNSPDHSGTWNSRTLTKGKAGYPTNFIHFKDLSSSSTPTPTPSPAPPIIALKSARSPDGTAIEVYAATNGRVTQHWYHDSGDSGTADITDQANIVGIDKINQANGTESVYTAVPDGVYESWWNSSSNGPQTSKIVYPGLRGITLSGVRGVIAENTIESGVTVHHLYILASDGPYEAWWKDGGDGVHLGRLIQINGPVAFTHSVGPDGSEQLYVAVPTWVYEVTWVPGSGVVNMYNVINITQGDIRSVDKGANLPDGSQLLYTTTATAVWQTWWNTTGGPYSQGTIATGQVNALQGLKVVTPDGVHHVYLALPDHVQEYWWLGANSGGGELIRISQGNITAISQILDGSMQLLLTAAGNNVWETWWNSSQTPTTPSTPLFSVTA